MHARHTQAPLQFRAVQTKTLVNRTRRKVVNIALTKKLSSFRDAPLGAGPESITPNRGYGFRARSLCSRPGMTLRLPRRGLAERGLRRGEPGDRHAVGRAGDVIEPDLVTERHRRRIAAVFAADAHLEVCPRLATALDADLHQFADAVAIDREERIDRHDPPRVLPAGASYGG